jgi:hypothetical protein
MYLLVMRMSNLINKAVLHSNLLNLVRIKNFHIESIKRPAIQTSPDLFKNKKSSQNSKLPSLPHSTSKASKQTIPNRSLHNIFFKQKSCEDLAYSNHASSYPPKNLSNNRYLIGIILAFTHDLTMRYLGTSEIGKRRNSRVTRIKINSQGMEEREHRLDKEIEMILGPEKKIDNGGFKDLWK